MYPSPAAERLARVFAGTGRPVLETLAALDAEWRLAVRPGIDHGVAHTKLAWWRTELARLGAAAPAHPLTRALAHAAAGPLDVAPLGARLDAADLALGGYAPGSLAELEALAARSHGSLWQLASALLAPALPAAAHAGAATLGRAFGLIAYGAPGAEGAPPELGARARGARALALLEAGGRALPPGAAAALAGLEVARALAGAALGADGRAAPGGFVQVFIAWRAARGARQPHDPRARP